MGVLGRRRTSKVVVRARESSLLGSYSADEVDAINTLNGIVSALCLSFVLGLQYIVGPNIDIDPADYRSLICKNEVFRTYAHQVLTEVDVGSYEHESVKFNVLVGPGHYFNVTYWLLEGVGAKHGNSPGSLKHQDCIMDKDVNTLVALTKDAFPMKLLNAFILQRGDSGDDFPDTYRYSRRSEVMAALSATFVFISLGWSIMFSISLALAPVREDESKTALTAWLMVGGIGIVIEYFFLIAGLILFFWANCRLLVALSIYGAETQKVFLMAFLHLVTPILVIGLVIGVVATIWSERNTPLSSLAPSKNGEDSAKESGEAALDGVKVTGKAPTSASSPAVVHPEGEH